MQLFRTNKIDVGKQIIYTLEFDQFTISKYFNFLTEQEIERALSFKSNKRQQEFVATRILRQEIFGFNHIHYNEVGAPFIKGEGFISISHANGIVGIAINELHEVSIDIETIGEKAVRLRNKFLSAIEKENLNIDSNIEMTKVWSLKEVLYKLTGKRGLHFKEHLQLEKQTEEKWLGRIIFDDTIIEVELFTFVKENVLISFNTDRKKIINERLP